MHELYREHLLEHYRHPRNATPLADPDATAEENNPLCGDRARAEIRLTRGRIAAVTFVVGGCVIATAAASLLSEAVVGKRSSQIEQFDYESMCRIIGVTVSPGRANCVLLPLTALRKAFAQVKKNP